MALALRRLAGIMLQCARHLPAAAQQGLLAW